MYFAPLAAAPLSFSQQNYQEQIDYSSSNSNSNSSNSNNDTTMAKSQDSTSSKPSSLKDMLSSKDWMADYRQNHVDIDLQREQVFTRSRSNSDAVSASSSLNNNNNSSTAAAYGSSAISNNSSSNNSVVPALKDATDSNATTTTAPSLESVKKTMAKATTDWMSEYMSSIGAPVPAANVSSAPAIDPLSKSFSSFPKPLRRLSSRSIPSRQTSLTKPGASMDSFKMSVDLSAFMTSSMDDAMKDLDGRSLSIDTTATTPLVPPVLVSPPPVAAAAAQSPIPMETDDMVADIVAITEKTKAEDAKSRAAQKSKTKQNKKKPRRNKDPDVKIYKEPSDMDVLLGRGGRSNHHPGNIAYRNEVGNLRDWYRSSEKNAKTDLSQLLVDWVQGERRGQFLKMEVATQRWYIVTNIVARRKSSQALREHMTKEEREDAKRKQEQGK